MKEIGFWQPAKITPWTPSEERDLPRAQDSVDKTWDNKERALIVKYLKNGTVCRHWCGWSDCRICGCDNGSVDVTDGVYLWPEGYVHYIEKHEIKPPQDFIDHVKAVMNLSTVRRLLNFLWSN